MNQQMYQKDRFFGEFIAYLKAHPGAAVWMSYLVLSATGLAYSWAFYRRFNLDFLLLAEVSDILIVGLRDPIIFVMFCGGVLVGYVFELMFLIQFSITQRWRERPDSIKKSLILALNYMPKSRLAVGIAVITVFVLYSAIFILYYGHWKSEQIKEGNGNLNYIYLADSQLVTKPVTIIGSNANYLFAYDQLKDKTYVFPVENVLRMEPVAPRADVPKEIMTEVSSEE